LKNSKILVVAAHPDDEVLGCGGTMAKLSMEGNQVYTLILGEGITARDENRDRTKRENEIKELKEQTDIANKILGVNKCFSFEFPDNRFDTVPLIDIVKSVEKVKKELRPDAVYTHHHGDLNVDHRVTLMAVMTAFRPLKGEAVCEIYSFEVPSSTEWNVPTPDVCFSPNCFVDISRTLEIKKKAMKEYKTEVREFPHPRSLKAIEIVAGMRGIQVGTELAEAFEVVRLIK
jgi:LmbE family N-acetylglucosaminyl deacetylase